MIFLRVFLRSASGIAGIAGVTVIIAVAILAPMLLDEIARRDDFMQARQLPSLLHPFGTDALGRDLLSRMLVATRLSLGMALVAEAISLCLAVPLGTVITLLPVGLRAVIMRVIDTMLALPGLIVTIYLATILAPVLGLFGLAIGIAVPSAFRLARVVSTQALAVASRDYFQAARVVGVRWPRLLSRYVLPNIGEPILVSSTTSIAFAILAFSGLSFLGIGVQPPDFDWGQMLTEGVSAIYVNPMAAMGPLMFICFAALSFAFLGEALARAVNPQLWTVENSIQLPRDVPATPNATSSSVAIGGSITLPERASSADAQGSAEIPMLQVKHLTVRFPVAGRSVAVVDNVSFDLHKGEMIGIVGESGSGKSMTAMGIADLVPYPGVVGGHVAFEGRPLDQISHEERARVLGTRFAIVFQDPMSSLNPALTVGRQLTEGIEHHNKASHAVAMQRAVERLREMNIPAPSHQVFRYPHEMSGGMRQRAMIAMGLMNQPQILVCDEPTTALDVTVQAQIMDLLNTLNEKQGLAIVLISHNLALIRQNCSRVLVMYAGRIVEELPSDFLVTGARHPYTRALLAAVPDMERPRDEPLMTIPGQPASAGDVAQGCPFRPRCPISVDRCADSMPEIVSIGRDQRVACWVSAEADTAGFS